MEKEQNYIINPLTNKPILVGGATYKSLVKQSIITDDNAPVKPQKKTQIVVKKMKNAEEAKQLKKQLPPAPKGKAYVALDNQVVMRDKRGKSISPDQYSKLFSKASVIVNKKLSSDPDFMKILENVGSVDDLPNSYKQKIEQMLMEEVMRVPNKKNSHIVVPDETTTKKLLKKQSKNYKDDEMSGYDSAYSIMSDDSEMNTIIRNKKKSNNKVLISSNNKKKPSNKKNEPKLVAVINNNTKRTSRPSTKTQISSETETSDYFGGETDDESESESECSSSESDS
jgi:hypothetical protein